MNSFLFDIEDVDELSKHLLKITTDSRFLETMQQEVHESVIDTYTIAGYIDQLETILRGLLKFNISLQRILQNFGET